MCFDRSRYCGRVISAATVEKPIAIAKDTDKKIERFKIYDTLIIGILNGFLAIFKRQIRNIDVKL